MSGRWADVGEPARELGISAEAIRKRIQRGKLRAERRQDRMQVWLDEVRTESGPQAAVEGLLVEELRGRVRFLEGQLKQANERDRENRRIIAALTSRIPELEAPAEVQGSAEIAGERSERGENQYRRHSGGLRGAQGAVVA